MELVKLGKTITDKATNLKGQLTHVQITGSDAIFYLFQPKGLNPETGHPVNTHWITEDRIKGGTKVKCDLPMEMMGSTVTDTASGLKGIVTSLELHINGCIHAIVQPSGTTKKTGNMIESINFDIRRLKGTKVPKFKDEAAKDKNQKEHPSPAAHSRMTPVSQAEHSMPGFRS